jgi:hypothetical protein
MALHHFTVDDLKNFKKQIDGWNLKTPVIYMNKADYDSIKNWYGDKRTYNICG